MKLKCSREHKIDTNSFNDTFYGRSFLKPGNRCPFLIAYDRMQGSTYCQRVLREVKANAAYCSHCKEIVDVVVGKRNDRCSQCGIRVEVKNEI